MKTEKEIIQALVDSNTEFTRLYPNQDPNAPVMKLDDLKNSITRLAIANEICTLKWVLGKGVLNCYSKKVNE